MLSAFTVGAVALGATLGIVPSATADPASDGGQKLFVDIVGDSYMAGDGTADTYLDSADPRHRSLASPALQALSRVADENPGIQVDANVVASSGAVTADYFGTQRAPDANGAEVVVNTAQHDQIRPNAQVVIVGFGGSDAELAQVLSIAKPSNSSKPGDLDAMVKNFGGLLDTSGTDQTYLDQATVSSPGQAPMLVSRLLQVLAGISERAPQARIFVTTYPLAVDPDNPHSVALIKKRDLITVQKFLFDLNAAIERAVRICACGTLVDLTDTLDGREAYTGESAYNEPVGDSPHGNVVIQPSGEGAALMAGPLAKNLADWLGVEVPKPGDGKVVLPRNIIARSGEPDVDGDLVPDFDDVAPQDPAQHRRKSDRPQREDSPERRDVEPSHHGRPKASHIPDRRGPGRHEKDHGPIGHLPVELVLPLSPSPKREHDPEPLSEDRRVAVPDAAERRPAPAAERVVADRETSGRGGDAVEIVPEAPIPAEEETGFAPSSGPRTSSDDEPDRLADSVYRLSERDEPNGVEWSARESEVEYRSESAGFGEEVQPEGREWLTEPPEAAPVEVVPEESGAENSTPEQIAPTDDAPAEPARSAEPVEFVPVESEVVPEEPVWPSDPVEFVPVESEVMPEEPVGPSEPVEVVPVESTWTPGPVDPEPVDPAPVEPEPVVEVPAPDEATDGQQVCVLIYPAPPGCGGAEQEGSFS